MYRVEIAYLLWFIGGFGALGLHRFYLGKIGTGIVWLCSFGCLGIGSFYDLVTLPLQVAFANSQRQLTEEERKSRRELDERRKARAKRGGLDDGVSWQVVDADEEVPGAPGKDVGGGDDSRRRRGSVFDSVRKGRSTKNNEEIERIILHLARAGKGEVTASDVALEAGCGLDRARETLERLATRGHCDMRLRENGSIVFVFPDFQDVPAGTETSIS